VGAASIPLGTRLADVTAIKIEDSRASETAAQIHVQQLTAIDPTNPLESPVILGDKAQVMRSR
jgi:hypothetical protein